MLLALTNKKQDNDMAIIALYVTNNLLKFVMDVLEETLYMNNTNIVCAGKIKKCHSTDILEAVGWTKLHFIKVVCIDP
jgi:hypothetical protein